MKKAALHNLGCKVNGYETEAMQELLEKDGYEIVHSMKSGRVCNQYLYGNEYCRQKIKTDASSGPENSIRTP